MNSRPAPDLASQQPTRAPRAPTPPDTKQQPLPCSCMTDQASDNRSYMAVSMYHCINMYPLQSKVHDMVALTMTEINHVNDGIWSSNKCTLI
jgi:hypothetical protein